MKIKDVNEELKNYNYSIFVISDVSLKKTGFLWLTVTKILIIPLQKERVIQMPYKYYHQ